MKAPRVCSTLLVYATVLAALASPSGALATTNPGPKPDEPWENSLGMKFVPVPGTNVLFSIWETRVQDFEAFVKATGHDAGERWRDPGAAERGANLHPDTVASDHLRELERCGGLLPVVDGEGARGGKAVGGTRVPLAHGCRMESGGGVASRTRSDAGGERPKD